MPRAAAARSARRLSVASAFCPWSSLPSRAPGRGRSARLCLRGVPIRFKPPDALIVVGELCLEALELALVLHERDHLRLEHDDALAHLHHALAQMHDIAAAGD